MDGPLRYENRERKLQNTTCAKPTRPRCSITKLMSEVGQRIDMPYKDDVSITAVITIDGYIDSLMGCVIN